MNIEQTPEQLQRVRDHADKTVRDTFAPVVGNPGSPLAELTRQRPDLVNADELDAYHGFPGLRPITIRNAGLLLRQATAALEAANLADKHARQAVTETKRALDLAKDAHARAEHRLRISALQPNGGEE